jgi:hypothetical protein
MKQISFPLFMALFLFAQTQSTAQVQWFSSSSNWDFHITTGWTGQGLEHISVSSNTTQVGGLTYTALRREFQYQTGATYNNERFVRQDGSKVYALTTDASAQYQPFLMYDFGLDVGDTVRLPRYGDASANFGYVVIKTDFVDILGTMRRLQEVSWFSNNQTIPGYKTVLVDGLGGVLGLHLIGAAWCRQDSYFFLDEPTAIAVDGSERTFCSHTDANGRYEGLGVDLCATVSTEQTQQLQISITPNPAREAITILSDDLSNLRYTLTDLTGRTIASGRVVQPRIETDYKGMALLTLQKDEARKTFKILFE